MKIGFLDIIIFISIFQLTAFTIFLITQKPYKISNIILGVFLFAQTFGEINSLFFSQKNYFYENYPQLFLIGVPFCFIWGPAIYLFVISIISDRFKLNLKCILHLVPFFASFLFLFVIFYHHSEETKRILLKSAVLYEYLVIIQYFVLLQILIYMIKSLFTLKTYRERIKENYSSISKINLSWLTFVIIGYAISYFISASFQVSGYVFGVYNYTMNTILFLSFLIFFNVIFFKAWRQPEIFIMTEENVKYKSSKLTREDAGIWIKKLNEYIWVNKSYLDPDLTINQLAVKLNISPRILSQIINEYFHQNFYDYINSLRIEESKKMLLDPSNNKNVLEILYEVGFNSKPSFNRAFKSFTGQTPTEFKKSVNKKSGVFTSK